MPSAWNALERSPGEAGRRSRGPGEVRAAALEALATAWQPDRAVPAAGGACLSDGPGAGGAAGPARCRSSPASNREDARPLLLEALPIAPARIQTAIAARQWLVAASGTEALLTAVHEGKASARLLQEPGRVRSRSATRESPPERLSTRLELLLFEGPTRRPTPRPYDLINPSRGGYSLAATRWPTPRTGTGLFEKHCEACHPGRGGTGGKVGPQLDGIDRPRVGPIDERTFSTRTGTSTRRSA